MQNRTLTPLLIPELLAAIRDLTGVLDTVGRRIGDLTTELDRSRR